MGLGDWARKAYGYTPAGRITSAAGDAINGNWRGAADDLASINVPYAAAKAGYNGAKDVYGNIKDAVNAPYDKAKEGFDVILGQLGNLKQERLKRKEDLYQRANSQFDDTRRAMAAVYGDPTKWSL